MAQILECTFNSINGDNTGVWTRTRPTKNSPSLGILYKKNCPDNIHFYCDPEGSQNTYYKLLDPEKYPGINATAGTTVYVPLSTSYLSGWRLVDDSITNPSQSNNNTTTSSRPNNNNGTNSANDNSISLATTRSTNIQSTKSTTTSDTITEYVSYTGKTSNALTPKGKFNEYTGKTKISDNYFMNYSSFIQDINSIEKNLNIDISAEAAATIKNDMVNKFNRFLTAFPTTALSKTFAHVFFTRPDLNLYNSNGSLVKEVANDPYFYFLNRNSPEVLKSLTRGFSSRHDFNPLLSNKAGSFDLKDEYIETGEYGETYTG